MSSGSLRMRRGGWPLLRTVLPALLLFIFALFLFANGLSKTRQSEQEEALKLARESITRAVMSCYALEGRYPESYDYLKEHYGIHIDETRYAIHYDIFASNIMPNITVVAQ